MLKKILLGLVVIVAALAAFATTKPDTFAVERSATIHAPAAKVYGYLDDFHHWAAWSPWEKLDPAMQRTVSGAPTGPGAVYAWTGNSDVGAGRMEITDATPASHLAIKLDFLKPFESHNVTEFRLEPQGDSTRVTWSMHGPNQYVSKLMGIFVSVDKMVGKDFETGLTNLKTLAER
jgi:uncharacterized protein YndB with AHSA1/START domain